MLANRNLALPTFAIVSWVADTNVFNVVPTPESIWIRWKISTFISYKSLVILTHMVLKAWQGMGAISSSFTACNLDI